MMLDRLAVCVAIGVLVGSPLAASAAAETPKVTFSGGGAGVLLCGSKPNPRELTVAEGTTVRITNELDSEAQLKIDGTPTATVDSGDSIDVQIHRGPVSFVMVPECPLNMNSKYMPLTVRIAEPSPSRSVSERAASPNHPGATSSPDSRAVVAARDNATPGSVILDGSAVTVVDAGHGAINRSAEAGSARQPIGLLAIIAIVCVAGVLAGAVRVIITQRATRQGLA
jgi:hypothetical protein